MNFAVRTVRFDGRTTGSVQMTRLSYGILKSYDVFVWFGHAAPTVVFLEGS